VTEATLSVGFVNWLRDHSKTSGIPVFRDIFSEVECKQGIPDIIGLSCNWKPSPVTSFLGDSSISLSAVSSVLALFGSRRSHTIEYLTSHSGLSKELARQVINVLCDVGLAVKSPQGSLRLETDLSWLESDLWAFELKVHDWRRALFQTLQYRTFASYEVVIMPLEKRHAVSRQLEFFKSTGVGVVLFDNQSNHEEILVQARRNRPTSRQHKIFAMCRLLEEHVRGTGLCARAT
jgi:hypothetical protein